MLYLCIDNKKQAHSVGQTYNSKNDTTMKTLRTTLTAVVLFIGALTANAQSMSITVMRDNARFLTDRMAFTLGIRDPYIIDEIYRINYDYIWGVNDYLDDVALGYYYDDYMAVVAARDAALRNLLGYRMWNRLAGYSYFHRPIVFVNNRWRFTVYDYDRYGVRHYHYGAPRPYGTYVGGRIVRPMPPRTAVCRPAPPRPAPRAVAPRVERRPAEPGRHAAPRETPRAHENRPTAPQHPTAPHHAAPTTKPDMGAYRGAISRGNATSAPRGNMAPSSRGSRR